MADEAIYKLALVLEDRIMQGDLGGLEVVVAIQIKRLMIRTRKDAIEQKAVASSLPGKNYDNIRKAIIGLEKKGVVARESGAVRFTLASGGNHRQPVEITGEEESRPVEVTGSTGGNHRTAPVEITGSETPEPANDAMATPVPKLSLETTLKNSPLTPLSESALVSGWVKEIFGVENRGEAAKLSEKSKDDLKDFLRYPVAAQERAVKVFRSWPASINSPLGFIFKVLKDPASFPVPFEAPEKPKRVNPYEAYPWGFLWDPLKRGTSSEDDWFMSQAQRCQDFGTGKWRDAWAIYEAEGLVAGMTYVWEHWPRQAREA